MRTHTCGELNKNSVDAKVTLCGWVQSRRDHGGVIFIDLRDRYGKTQIVFNSDCANFNDAGNLKREDVIKVSGSVRLRGEDLKNPKLSTGDIEVVANDLVVINKSITPPIEIEDLKLSNDDIRLEYRYLDLRRPIMQRNLLFRNNVIQSIRGVALKNSFLEIETPLLVKSTPEGARDYVVPSRVNKGAFYALPQSPQLYKQLLMIGGCDRYFQIARCLRDEDLRADRQPEHTQFDFEMSFSNQKQIQSFVEQFLAETFKTNLGVSLDLPFPVLSYTESMNKYATDKPDIRYDLFVNDVTEIVKNSEFGVFSSVAQSGGKIKAINPEVNFGRTELDNYIKFAQENGAKGLAWMRVTEDLGLESNIAKYFTEEQKKQLISKISPKPNSVLMFIADNEKKANFLMDKLRRKLAEDLKLFDDKDFKFAWINDFPLFSYNEEESRWEPEHHMFSMPKEEFIKTMSQDPSSVLGDLWDLTLNGVEMASGSIRVSNPTVQKEIMKIIGMSEEEADDKFGFLLKAYQYGGPIHGGMGLGIDRLVAVMLGYSDIREVIAFPKNKSAECPMDGSPGVISTTQLKELGIEIKKDNK